MRPSTVISGEAQAEFWSVVEECLRAFHPDRVNPAIPKLQSLQERLENAPIRQFEMFFHSEPFDIACTLADRELDVQDHLTRYLAIRDGANAPRR